MLVLCYSINVWKECMVMDKNLLKYGLDENQTKMGLATGKLLSYDSGVIEHLDTTDKIITYNILAPFSSESKKLAIIISKIEDGEEITDKDSDYLDSIDSRLIGHKDIKRMTPRETLCSFLNQYWDWSSYEWGKYRNVAISLNSMFSEYTQFCDDKKIPYRHRIKKSEAKQYLMKYSKLERTQVTINGKRLDNYVLYGLPMYRDPENSLPSFDRTKYLE